MSQTEVDVIALGRVLDEGRGSLPYSLVHGEALVAAATWGLTEAEVLPLDTRTSTEGVLDAELPLVLHDALCPMTPPEFIAACVRRAVEADVVVAGVLPVTDTVKVLHDGLVGETLDRDALVRVVSPVVVPVSLVERVSALLADPGRDLADLVEALRALATVELLEAPAEAMRVSTPEDLRVLEALTRR
jgi:2-C-methyl-D-erythritol 4-phosphate cytidylyltransferase